MTARPTLSFAEHKEAAKQLIIIKAAAMSLLKQLGTKSPEKCIDQGKVLLNVISTINLQLEDICDRDFGLEENPYRGASTWFSIGS